MEKKTVSQNAQIAEIVFFDTKNETNCRRARIVVSPESFEETAASIEVAIRTSMGIGRQHRMVAVEQHWNPGAGQALFRVGDGQERREILVRVSVKLPAWEE